MSEKAQSPPPHKSEERISSPRPDREIGETFQSAQPPQERIRSHSPRRDPDRNNGRRERGYSRHHDRRQSPGRELVGEDGKYKARRERRRSHSPLRNPQQGDNGRERHRDRSPRHGPERQGERKERNRSRSPCRDPERQGERKERKRSRSPRRDPELDIHKRKGGNGEERSGSRSPRFPIQPESQRSRGSDPDRVLVGDGRNRDSNMNYDRKQRDERAQHGPEPRAYRHEKGPDYRKSERDSDRRGRDGSDRNFEPRYRDREDRPPPKKNLGGFHYKDKRREDQRDDRDGDRRGGSFRGYRDRPASPRRRDRPDTTKPPKRAPAASTAVGQEKLIKVLVNNRLGTKAEINCLPSTTIKSFRGLVASATGHNVNRIKLQRQGQRQFVDQMTLWDYEIGNGSSLDLEIGTNDD